MAHDVIPHRLRTLANLKAWHLNVRWGPEGSKYPAQNVGQLGLVAPKQQAWADTPSAPEFRCNLFAALRPDLVDCDLDVRLAERPELPPLQWTPEQRALAITMCFEPWSEALLRLNPTNPHGVTRKAFWGRESLDGYGHALFQFQSGAATDLKEASQWLRSTRFKNAKIGPFLVSNDIRVGRGPRSEILIRLPGSEHSDGDLVVWQVLPTATQAIDPHLAAYDVELLVQAMYRAGVLMLAGAQYVEGQRHDVALKVSGMLRREVVRGEALRDTPSPRLTEAGARAIFEALLAGDNEASSRRKVFERDLQADPDGEKLPGYRAFGALTGNPDVAMTLSRMLHGVDWSTLEEIEQRLVFLGGKSQVVDTGRKRDGELTTYSYEDMAKLLMGYTAMIRDKAYPVFRIISGKRTRRTVDNARHIPGYPMGDRFYITPAGVISPTRQTVADEECINLSSGWAHTPGDDVPGMAEGQALLDQMLGWITTRIEDRTKIMQMLAFKAQNPLVKPQFALAVMGGQGIGKSFFFGVFLRNVFGRSVKSTNVAELYDGNYALTPAIGASILVVDEADNLLDFAIAKSLHRNDRMPINVKFGEKGEHYLFCIPVYLTNALMPRLNDPGDPDRTLYIIQAPTAESCNLSYEEWQRDFIPARHREVEAVIERLAARPELLDAIMAVLLDYPVTLEELQRNDSPTDEAIAATGMSPEQSALYEMLHNNCLDPDYPSYRLDRPFNKFAFDRGFNSYYIKYAPHGARHLTGIAISKSLKHILGDAGKLGSTQRRFGTRISRLYWFPQQLGSLCTAFQRRTGVAIDLSLGEIGPYEPTEAEISVALKQYAAMERPDIHNL